MQFYSIACSKNFSRVELGECATRVRLRTCTSGPHFHKIVMAQISTLVPFHPPPPPKPHPCRECGKGFAKKDNLTQHARRPRKTLPWRCRWYCAAFLHERKLIVHMCTHVEENPFSCDLCNARFADKPARIAHMQTHAGEWPFPCGVCRTIFSEKRASTGTWQGTLLDNKVP